MATNIRIFCWVLLVIVLPSRCAPRSKHSKTVPQTVYDQKQTGDYNIQLHLKDFQIIALLADDSIGALGDYDYNYDYSDFTVKPATQKPSSSPPPSSSSPVSQEPSSTLKPTNHPYPILAPNITQSPQETVINVEQKLASEEPNKNEDSLNEVGETTTPCVNQEKESAVNSTTRKHDVFDEPNSPGKIKVQIIETPVGVVPGEEDKNSDASLSGNVVQLRRCATGFTRDKKGRCRRLRRPSNGSSHLPFGFSRLATNFASRFRYASPDISSLSSSELTEN